MRFLLFALLLMQVACAAPVQQAEKVQRVQMQKSGFVLKSPDYEPRIARYDEKTGETVTYDHKPRIELIDEKAGKYAMKWIGHDGKEKVVVYQRHDAVDIIVAASVTKMSDGKYLYTYNVQSLPTGGTYLSIFILQNFAADVEPEELDNMYVGRMSSQIQQFKNGNWISFGILPTFEPAVVPGQSIELTLSSSAPPGLIGCRVYGGQTSMEGAGEDLPRALDDLLPGYEVLPRGYTIGPVDNLKTLSPIERAKYVVNLLPQLGQLGWITEDAARWYKRNLNGDNLGRVQKRAGQDLKAEQITSEVFAMIEAIN